MEAGRYQSGGEGLGRKRRTGLHTLGEGGWCCGEGGREGDRRGIDKNWWV